MKWNNKIKPVQDIPDEMTDEVALQEHMLKDKPVNKTKALKKAMPQLKGLKK